jgi:predicted outer membrane lipoprotein
MNAILTILAGLILAASFGVIAASLMRCRHCGRWHNSAAEEQRCEEKNEL